MVDVRAAAALSAAERLQVILQRRKAKEAARSPSIPERIEQDTQRYAALFLQKLMRGIAARKQRAARLRPQAQRQHTVPIFTSADTLAEWLTARGLNVSEWGSGTAKPVKKLFEEVQQRESELVIENGRVLRCLCVAKMRIHRPDSSQFLVEAKQVLADGRERVRGDVPGEKMFAGEDPLEAAVRGCREELGARMTCEPTEIALLHKTVEVKPSASYPNLMSRYSFYEVQLCIGSLPARGFETVEVQGEKQVRHVWAWREAMIQPQRGLALPPTQTRLLERLFAGASRVEVEPLHGGLSGSTVLRTVSYDAAGAREEPTVTKIDQSDDILREVKQTNFIARLIGGDACVSVLHGPFFSEEQSTHVLAFAEAQIDAPLRERLLDGSIRLVRCAWLASPQSDAQLATNAYGIPILRRRQDMPAEAYFPPAEAAGLLDRDDRSLLVLSYPWQTAGHPDPNGTTLAAVRRYLRSEPTNACALFLDYVRRAASIRCPLGRACGCCSARALLPDGPWIDTVYGSSPSSKKAPTADGCCQRRCARSHRRGGAAYELMHAHISRPPTVDVPSPAVRALRRLSSAR